MLPVWWWVRSQLADPEQSTLTADQVGFTALPSIAGSDRTTYTNTWTPPTDEIGLELPPLTTTIALQCESLVHDLVPHVHMHTRSAPPGPWGCAAPPLRHMTILQV